MGLGPAPLTIRESKEPGACCAHEDGVSPWRALEIYEAIARNREMLERDTPPVVLKLCPKCYDGGSWLPEGYRRDPLR